MPGSVVRVWEETGPDAAPGLEWLLLCDQSVTDFTQALTCARQYASRWLVEDFHKALKTGLGAHPAGKPSGSAAGACACSWRA